MSEINPNTVITITRDEAKISYDVDDGLYRWRIIEFEEEKGGGVDMDKEQKEWMKNHTKADLAMQVINSRKALQRQVNVVIRLEGEKKNCLIENRELMDDIAKSATLMKAAARTINNLQFELKGVNEDNTALLVELEEARKTRDYGHKDIKDWGKDWDVKGWDVKDWGEGVIDGYRLPKRPYIRKDVPF